MIRKLSLLLIAMALALPVMAADKGSKDIVDTAVAAGQSPASCGTGRHVERKRPIHGLRSHGRRFCQAAFRSLRRSAHAGKQGKAQGSPSLSRRCRESASRQGDEDEVSQNS